MFELQAIQTIFIIKEIDILAHDEIYKKSDTKKQRVLSAFEKKTASPKLQSTLQNSETVESAFEYNSENHKKIPLMEMTDHTKVSDILSYSRNEIKVVCKF